MMNSNEFNDVVSFFEKMLTKEFVEIVYPDGSKGNMLPTNVVYNLRNHVDFHEFNNYIEERQILIDKAREKEVERVRLQNIESERKKNEEYERNKEISRRQEEEKARKKKKDDDDMLMLACSFVCPVM